MTSKHPPPDAAATDEEMVQGTCLALKLLAPKARVEILYLLARGARTIAELCEELRTVPSTTLLRSLRALESHRLVARRSAHTRDGCDYYALTSLGWSLTGPMMTLYEWSAEQGGNPARAVRPRTTTNARMAA